MRFVPVEEKDYDACFTRMETAFPYNERRDREQWTQLFKFNEFHCYFLQDELNANIVGFVTFWKYDEFVFIEHLAIDVKFRGKGYGTEFLKDFRLLNKTNIILEVEPPVSEQAIKRIKFYRKSGFFLNDGFYYEQPSYHKAERVPLILMSTVPLRKEDFNKFIERTRSNCYKDC